MIYLLQRIGAEKCSPDTVGCVDGCAHWSNSKGEEPEQEASTPIEDTLKKGINKSIINFRKNSKRHPNLRVLFLLQKKTEYFDAVMANTIDAAKKRNCGDRVKNLA